ncbi:hypothetical protein [Serratia proteamaculans]
MTLNVRTSLQLSGSSISTTSAIESTSATALHNDKVPDCPSLALASLIEAISDAKNVGYDWTQDEYIGEQMNRCFKLSPELKEFLSQKTNLTLAEVPDGKSQLSVTALTGTPLSEQETARLADVLEGCFLEMLAQPGVAEPFSEGEGEKLEQLQQHFNQKISALQATEFASVGKELETLFMAKATEGESPEAESATTLSWEDDLPMLQEFRRLQGKNHEFLLVDNKALEASMAQLSSLADGGAGKVTGQAAVALRALCQNILDKVPAETGDHKLWMREVISGFSGLSAALLAADVALSHAHDYQAAEKKGGKPQLPGEVNEAKATLSRAWRETQNTVELLGQKSDFGWMLDFKGAIKGHFATLEVMCPAVINALKNERTQLVQDTEVEKARLTIETAKLSSLEKSTHNSVIRDVSNAVNNCCKLATKALAQPLSDYRDMKKTAEALFDVSETLQTADNIMNVARQLPASGADKAVMDYVAVLLEKQVKTLRKAVDNLSACAQPLEFDVGATKRFSPIQKALNDLGVAVRLEKKTLLQVGDELRSVKHTLKPAKSTPEVAIKKVGEGLEYSKTYLSKAVMAVDYMLRFTGQTAVQGGRHLIHKGEQKVGRVDDYEKQSVNALLRATAHGPCSGIKNFRVQIEQFMGAINKLEKADGARIRNPQDGVLSRGRNNNAPGTTKAERLTGRLTTLTKPQAAVQGAQRQIIAEAEKTETDLDLMAERYPEYTKEIQQFRMQLRESVKTCQKANNLCHQAMESLSTVKMPVSEREHITLDNLRNGMNGVAQATEASIKAAETVRGLRPEERTKLESALHRASAAVSQLIVHLNAKTPDRAEVNVAFEQAETALYANELIADRVTGKVGGNLEKARHALSDVRERASTWKSDETAAPLLLAKQPGKKEIRQTLKTMADAIYSVGNTAGKMEGEVARITGKRLNVFSTDARIIKHLAGLLAGQSGAVMDKLSPSAREIHQWGIDETIKEITGYFRKPGDASGNAFALRLQKEYQRANEGTMVMPRSTKEVMGKHSSWQEQMVHSGAKGLQSRAVYTMAHQALEVALNTALPGLSIATGLRSLAKLAMTPVTLVAALGELEQSLMPGHALPLGSKSDLIKNQLAIAANRAVQVFLPAIVKLAKDLALTGVQVWRDGAETVINKTKERLPEDVVMTAAGEAFSSGLNVANDEWSKMATNNATTLEKPTATSLNSSTPLSADASGSVKIATDKNNTAIEETGLESILEDKKVKRSLGDGRLYVDEPKSRIIDESDVITMQAHATNKYEKLKANISSDGQLNTDDRNKLKDIYNLAYPHNMNINQQMKVSLAEIFSDYGESNLTPDSKVSFDVYHMNADGVMVRKNAQPQQGTLLDLARGAYFHPNEEIRVRDLPVTIRRLYHVIPYVGGPNPQINSMLEHTLKGKLYDFNRIESRVFREKIWQGKMYNTLCNLYDKEKIVELKEVMEGKRKPSLITYESVGLLRKELINIGGTFAIKKDNGDMILVSVQQQKTLTIKLNSAYSPAEEKKLRDFLLPHFCLNQHQRLSAPVYEHEFSTKIKLKNSHHQYQNPQKPEKLIYRSPLSFTQTDSIEKIGEDLSYLELHDMKNNINFLLTTDGEAWAKELINQGQKLVNGLMLATAVAPTHWGVALFNLGLSMASYGLSAAEIALEDDASKKDQLEKSLLMDIVLSTPSDIGDAVDVLNKFNKMRSMKITNASDPSTGRNPVSRVHEDSLSNHSNPMNTHNNPQGGDPLLSAHQDPVLQHANPVDNINLQGFEQPPAPTISKFEQYNKPDNVIYRQAGNKIGDGKIGSVYLIDDHQVIKDYRPKKIPRTPTLDYEGTYKSAQRNADAFNRLYGDDSATVYRYLENGQQKISAKLKQIDGETLLSLSSPKGKYSAIEVDQLFSNFKKEDVDKLIDDLVQELSEKGVVYKDFAQGNFIYDVDQKKLRAIDFDEAVIKQSGDVVSEAEKIEMRDGLTELFNDFKADVDTNRLKMLQGNIELDNARAKFASDVNSYQLSHDSDDYQHLTTRQKNFHADFNLGYNSIKKYDTDSLKEIKEKVFDVLGSDIKKQINKMSEKELIEFFNNSDKYEFSLSWQERGILSRYIQKLGEENRLAEVTQRLHNSAYQNTKVKGLTRHLYPQERMITAANVKDKGRCLPLVLVSEAAYSNGQMKQLEKNYKKIIDRVNVTQSKAFIQGVDQLHTQRIDASIVSVIDKGEDLTNIMPKLTIAEMVDKVEQSKSSASFLVTSEKHAMSMGVKIDAKNKKTYHFQEPNIGWLEFKDVGSMKEYMNKTIGNKEQAKHFGAYFADANSSDARYRFAPINVDKLKNVKVDGMGEWTIADFSSEKTVVPISPFYIKGRAHDISLHDAGSDNLQGYSLASGQSLYSVKRPDFSGAGSEQQTKITRFVAKLVAHKVKMFVDTDSTAASAAPETELLKEELRNKGITYISKSTVSYKMFMNENFHYPTGNVSNDAKMVTELDEMVSAFNRGIAINRNSNIMVCDSSGNGIPGILKSAIEMRRLLDENSDEFSQEILDKKPSTEITTAIKDDFSSVNSQDNAAYSVTQQSINNVRDEHPTAIERPSDVALLNAYADYRIARSAQTSQRVPPILKSVTENELSSNIDVQHNNANQSSNAEEPLVGSQLNNGQQPSIPLVSYKTKEGDTGSSLINKYGLELRYVYVDNQDTLRGISLNDPLPVGTELKLRIPQSAQPTVPVEENTLSRQRRSVDLFQSVGNAKDDIIIEKFKTSGLNMQTADRVKNDKIKVEVYHPFNVGEVVASREFSPADVASGQMKVFIQDKSGWFREKTGMGYDITWPSDYSDDLKYWLEQSFMVDQLDRAINSPETIDKAYIITREDATNIIDLYMKTHASRNVGTDKITPADLDNVTQVKFCDGVIPNLFIVKGRVFSLNPNFVPVKLSDVKDNILKYPEIMDEIKSGLPVKFIIEQGDNLFKTPKNIFGGVVVTRRDIIELGDSGKVEDMLTPQVIDNYHSDFDYTTKSKEEFLVKDLATLAKIGFAFMPVWMPMLGVSKAVNITVGLLSATPSMLEGIAEDDLNKSEKHFKDAMFSMSIHSIAGVISADKIAQLKILSENTAKQFVGNPKNSLNVFTRHLIKADEIVRGKSKSAAEVFDNLKPPMRILMVRLAGRDVNLAHKLISDTMKKMSEEEKNGGFIQRTGPGTTKFSPANQSVIYETNSEESVRNIAKRLYPTVNENDVIRQIFSRNAAILINPDKPVHPVTHLILPNYRNESGSIIFSPTGQVAVYTVTPGESLRDVAKNMYPNLSEDDAIRGLSERNMTMLIKPNQKVKAGSRLDLPATVN